MRHLPLPRRRRQAALVPASAPPATRCRWAGVAVARHGSALPREFKRGSGRRSWQQRPTRTLCPGRAWRSRRCGRRPCRGRRSARGAGAGRRASAAAVGGRRRCSRRRRRPTQALQAQQWSVQAQTAVVLHRLQRAVTHSEAAAAEAYNGGCPDGAARPFAPVPNAAGLVGPAAPVVERTAADPAVKTTRSRGQRRAQRIVPRTSSTSSHSTSSDDQAVLRRLPRAAAEVSRAAGDAHACVSEPAGGGSLTNAASAGRRADGAGRQL